jgi:hypothetical protein
MNDESDRVITFIRDVKNKFDIIIELLCLEAVKGPESGEDVYERLSENLE